MKEDLNIPIESATTIFCRWVSVWRTFDRLVVHDVLIALPHGGEPEPKLARG